MAFNSNPPAHVWDAIDRQISQQFAAADQDRVKEMIRPFMEGDAKLAKYILLLSRGKINAVANYVESAKNDSRDIIFWVENPEESRLETPEKIEDFQKTCEWLGIGRDSELDRYKTQLESKAPDRRIPVLPDEPGIPKWVLLLVTCGVILFSFMIADSRHRHSQDKIKKERPAEEIPYDYEMGPAFKKLYGSPEATDVTKQRNE
ncbi:hypothetical protein [Botrimarina mediterranea]|nr:hypothetical protein K2D_31760 [Planctomycetes bacterium K2D]